MSGCAAESADDGSAGNAGNAGSAGVGSEDWGDENKYPELGGKFASLAALSGTCAFVNGVVTVTSTAAQTIVIGKNAVDSTILVNGATCSTTASPPVAATASLMKRLVVTGSSNAEVLILDFLGGLFAPGVSSLTAGGIAIDLGTGTDDVRIRGTSNVDAFTMGGDGLAFNADNFKDITFAGVETVSVALAGGNDTFTGTNPTPTKGVTGNAPSAIALTLFGGDGADVIVSGDAADYVYGGPGADTLSGGGGVDNILGEEGADTIAQGLAADGAIDIITCGTDALTVAAPVDVSIDAVSWAQRTAPVAATIGGAGGPFTTPSGVVTLVVADADTIATDCESLIGTALADFLTGSSGANVLSGGAGNDTLAGMAGNDTLNGNDGDDLFIEEGTSADNGADVFNGGAGTDTVDYSTRTAKITVTMDGTDDDDGLAGEQDNIKADVENLLGGSAGDDISGNGSANVITGNNGDDVLHGLAGNDTFIEWDAAEAVAMAPATANGADTFIGGGGEDTVDYSGRQTAITVTMGADDTNVSDGYVSENDDVQDDVEDLIGGIDIDTITGNDSANWIRGGLGLDVIFGGNGDDKLDGEGGNATIDCGAGTDIALNFAGSRNVNCEI